MQLVELLYTRLFRLAAASLLGLSALAMVLALATGEGSPRWSTAALAAAGAIGGGLAVGRSDSEASVYRYLRNGPARQLTPALTGAALLLIAPQGLFWFVALAAIAMTAVLGSLRETLVGVTVVVGGYLAGTLIAGGSVSPHAEPQSFAELLGIPLIGLLLYATAEWLGRFVLQLHRFEAAAVDASFGSRPRRVPNLADRVSDRRAAVRRPGDDRERHPVGRLVVRSGMPVSRLTARQCEVLLLVRDGLRQGEIASCLAISTRQVERHLAESRRRTSAATSGELVAILVTGGLVPPFGAS